MTNVMICGSLSKAVVTFTIVQQISIEIHKSRNLRVKGFFPDKFCNVLKFTRFC